MLRYRLIVALILLTAWSGLAAGVGPEMEPFGNQVQSPCVGPVGESYELSAAPTLRVGSVGEPFESALDSPQAGPQSEPYD